MTSGSLPLVDTTTDDRPSFEVVASSMRRPSAWAVGVGFLLVVGARWVAFGGLSARALVGGLVAVAVPMMTVGVCLGRGRRLTAAAVVLATTATVVAGAADGRWQGFVALVAIALAAWSDRRGAQIALGVLAAVSSGLWWRSGFDRGAAPGPSWREVAGETGSVVRRALSSVGVDEMLVPLSGALAWWLAAGVLVGAALVEGRTRRAAWVPVSLAVFVVGVWAIRLWRGSVDPIGGAWIVAIGIVLAGSRPDGAIVDERAEQRMAATVTILAGLALVVALVRELRAVSDLATLVAGSGAMLVGFSLVTPPDAMPVSDRAGDGAVG